MRFGAFFFLLRKPGSGFSLLVLQEGLHSPEFPHSKPGSCPPNHLAFTLLAFETGSVFLVFSFYCIYHCQELEQHNILLDSNFFHGK